MAERRALVIHGHFYQPPRENPYTGAIPRERGAAPYHDYNERIHAECYRANAFARILDASGDIVDIVNNYAWMSFNFGPTLMRWIQSYDHRCYRRIIEADRSSVQRLGHGNALAQAHGHAILPLCNDRDLRTEVRWGLREFAYRYGRAAEAMWLPETACDDRVLSVLVEEGLRFVVLAPRQAGAIKRDGVWRELGDAGIDTRRPYRWCSPDGSGRELALFFYNGPLSRAVAFDNILSSSAQFIDRCEEAAGEGGLVQVVTDGESYGHHFRHGERCLAHAVAVEAKRRNLWLTNYATYLEQHPAEQQVRLATAYQGEGTSWSCEHGVSRWYRNCGCSTGGEEYYDQAWRGPLRAALDQLRDEAARVFEEQVGALLDDPWALRDAYVDVLINPGIDKEAWLEAQQVNLASSGHDSKKSTRDRLWKLLDSQHSALSMYTSCGWFFSDIGGIEAAIVMRHAGQLIDQLRALTGASYEQGFLSLLAEARSNDSKRGNGADIFREVVERAKRPADDRATLNAQPLSEDPFLQQLAGLRRDLFDQQALRILLAGLPPVDGRSGDGAETKLSDHRSVALAQYLSDVLEAEVRRLCAGYEDVTHAAGAAPLGRVQRLLSFAEGLNVAVDFSAAQEQLFEVLRGATVSEDADADAQSSAEGEGGAQVRSPRLSLCRDDALLVVAGALGLRAPWA